MKNLIIIVGSILAIIGLVGMIGTFGALDLETIPLKEAFLQACGSLLIFFGGLTLTKIAGAYED